MTKIEDVFSHEESMHMRQENACYLIFALHMLKNWNIWLEGCFLLAC